MTKQRILLFGGTFNPIHVGHLLMAQEAVERLNFDKVIFIPSAIPPFKKSPVSFSQRLKMVTMAIDGIDYFEVSDIEAKRGGPSYTIDTVRYFKEKCQNWAKIYWMIGSDCVKELTKWHKIRELLDECIFVIAERNQYRNYEGGDFMSFVYETLKEIADINQPIMTNHFTPLINRVLEISSSDIRDRLRCDESIRFLVPEAIEQYIKDNELYSNNRQHIAV
ncbi:MAG: nicotinate (nicotinamide) nucleotide adenylyltransferase [Candidatus Asgardarchaeia archaeon]